MIIFLISGLPIHLSCLTLAKVIMLLVLHVLNIFTVNICTYFWMSKSGSYPNPMIFDHYAF